MVQSLLQNSISVRGIHTTKKKDEVYTSREQVGSKNCADQNLPGARGLFRKVCMFFLHLHLWVYCSFLPQSIDMHLGMGNPTKGWSGRWWMDGEMEGNDASIIKASRVTAFHVVSGSLYFPVSYWTWTVWGACVLLKRMSWAGPQ